MSTRCEIDSEGRVTGPLRVTYNQPWPCRNGTEGMFQRPARGVVLHTEDGFQQGTVAWFNNPESQASATFAVGRGGNVHQFGPVGHGWAAWHAADANATWYGIEDADNTHPLTPFTPEQVHALALLVEVLARHDGVPLTAATDPFTMRGVALHSEGGAAWGGHAGCPGPVRAAQRPAILAAAHAIRHHVAWQAVTADGQTTIAAYAAQHKTAASTILRLTCEHGPAAPEFEADVAAFINAVAGGSAATSDPVPAGAVLVVPAS